MSECRQASGLSLRQFGMALLAALTRVALFGLIVGLGVFGRNGILEAKVPNQFPPYLAILPLLWLALHVACFAVPLLAWPVVRQALLIFSEQRRWEMQTLANAVALALVGLLYALVSAIIQLVFPMAIVVQGN